MLIFFHVSPVGDTVRVRLAVSLPGSVFIPKGPIGHNYEITVRASKYNFFSLSIHLAVLPVSYSKLNNSHL